MFLRNCILCMMASPRGARPRQRKTFLAASLLLAAAWAPFPSIVRGEAVSGGSQVDVWTPTAYDSLTVAGTSPGGTSSRLSVYANLQVTNDVGVTDGGVLYREANVAVGGSITVDTGGSLVANGGLLTANRIVLDGFIATNGWSSTIGDFVTHDLSIAGGARLTEVPTTAVMESGTLTLGMGTFFSMNPTDSGTMSLSLLRQNGGEFYSRSKIAVPRVECNGGGVDLSALVGVQEFYGIDGSFSISDHASLSVADLDNTYVTRSGGATLAVGDLRVTDTILNVYGGDDIGLLRVDGALVRSANSTSGTITIDRFTVSGTYNAPAQAMGSDLVLDSSVDVVLAPSAPGESSSVGPGTTVSLARISGPGASISVDNGALGLGSEGSRSSIGRVSVSGSASSIGIGRTTIGELHLSSRAWMALKDETSITDYLSIGDGSTLSLYNTNLACNTIGISGSGSGVQHNLQNVSTRTLSISGPTHFASRSEDVFQWTISLSDRASFSASRDMLSLSSIYVSSSATFMKEGHAIGTYLLNVSDAEWTHSARDSISGILRLANTTFTLAANLTIPELDVRQGTSSIQGLGHFYTASTLSLWDGGRFTLTPGNVVTSTVSFNGPSNSLTASTPLDVRQVTFRDDSAGSVLTLAGFTGTSAAGTWGLRVPGNSVSSLGADINAGRIISPAAAGPMSVTYDAASDSTLVTVANPFAQQSIPAGQSLATVSYTGGSGTAATTASFAAGVASGTGSTVTLMFLPAAQGLYSQTVDLQGTNGVSQVLQLTYDPTGLTPLQEESLYLLWFRETDNQWVNSVLGNTGTNPGYTGTAWMGSWQDYLTSHPGATLESSLGAFGVDVGTNTTWAAINHNSQFGVGPAAVPEPSSMAALTSLALAGALWRRVVMLRSPAVRSGTRHRP